jgi:hypothetical protein
MKPYRGGARCELVRQGRLADAEGVYQNSSDDGNPDGADNQVGHSLGQLVRFILTHFDLLFRVCGKCHKSEHYADSAEREHEVTIVKTRLLGFYQGARRCPALAATASDQYIGPTQ